MIRGTGNGVGEKSSLCANANEGHADGSINGGGDSIGSNAASEMPSSLDGLACSNPTCKISLSPRNGGDVGFRVAHRKAALAVMRADAKV